VHLSSQERRLFIDGRGSTGGVQWRPAHGSGRQGSEEGAALACAAGCGVLQACPSAMGGVEMVWFRGGQGRGPGVFFLFSSMSHGWGLGRGDWGSTARRQGRSTGTAMWARAYEEAVIYSKLGVTDFCPQGVRHNVRKK
jgi:hypothetical protein